jgi:hypothetical protein
VIASAILLYAYRTLGTVLCVGRDVIGGLTVIRTFRQPLFDGDTVGRRMVVVTATETKARFADLAGGFFGAGIAAS